jgi:disulfide bond formation protein DsbB
MSESAALLTDILAVGVLALEFLVALLLVLFVLERKQKQPHSFLMQVRSFALPVIFLASLLGSALTLVYSEVFGYLPCSLCWLQRVFLYPVVILSGMALYKKDRSIFDYLIGVSIPGLVIAIYQHYLQMGGGSLLPCPASPGVTDCAQRIIFEFGHITFPYMAAALFASIIVISLIARRRN